ncbi:hypothetical protein K525DRAFT_176946, partial [Schizophyllum commune Loenen D]
VGLVRGEKVAIVTHLIGGGPGNRIPGCQHASNEAKEQARRVREAMKDGQPTIPANASAVTRLKRQAALTQKVADPTQLQLRVYKSIDVPFSPAEAKAFRAKAMRATLDANLPFSMWDNMEILELFGMMRTDALRILPSAKSMSGTMLSQEADNVKQGMIEMLQGRKLGLSTDGWKSRTKDGLNAVCVNVDYKVHTLELVDTTSLDKTGEAHCALFKTMIDKVEKEYKCLVVYFVTDADGGSRKGRKLLTIERPYIIAPDCWGHQGQLMLGDYFKVSESAADTAEQATALISWINNHSKVRRIFDAAQAEVSRNKPGGVVKVLAYLVANLTRWTTHVVAFIRLVDLKQALQLAVLSSREKIIAAQVGAATSTEKARLETEAEEMCERIQDSMFWNGLENVLGDLEAICFGININQKDSTRADQVLLMIAGIYLQFEAHPEPAVRVKMLERLEKRWKDADQPVYMVALMMNPFEGLSRFGPHAGLDPISCHSMVITLYRRLMNRPDNEDSPAMRQKKENELGKAFLAYLGGTGKFKMWRGAKDVFESVHGRDPIAVWAGYESDEELRELALFAKMIFGIVVNTAGCERTFSHLKIIQTPHRARLGKDKLEAMTKISSKIRADNLERGVVKLRGGRKNHKNTDMLMSVPRYRDLLEDQADEDPSERGRLLVSSAAGWRTEMAKW